MGFSCLPQTQTVLAVSLVGLGQGKVSCCLKTDFVGGFGLFRVDVPSGNYDVRFLRPQFYKVFYQVSAEWRFGAI